LTQVQFNVLVSFVYNVGIKAFYKVKNGVVQKNEPTNILKLLNSGQKFKAGIKLLDYNKSNGRLLSGLVKRRNIEMNMFIQDVIKNM